MTRNLKALGLALMAVFAMSAVTASAASAQGQLTSQGEADFFLIGTELEEGNSFTYPGLPAATCTGSHFKGSAVNSAPNPLKHGATQITIHPEYTHCTVGIFPATVNMTTCDYLFTLGGTTENADTYGISAALVCPNEVEPHLEIYSDIGHTNRICTITFTGEGLESQLHATETTDGESNIRIHGTVNKIHAKKSGGGCGGPGTTTEGVYHVNAEVKGVNEEGTKDVPIDISHGA